MHKLIVVSGFFAVILLLATFILGVTELNFHLHKLLGFLTVIFGVTHLALNVSNKIAIKRKINKAKQGN
jgi:hypothetical protein